MITLPQINSSRTVGDYDWTRAAWELVGMQRFLSKKDDMVLPMAGQGMGGGPMGSGKGGGLKVPKVLGSCGCRQKWLPASDCPS